ncbi:MAG: Crp/Fnr family transcriptional regulator [Pseudomonadota bacterium]|nr:Crp/Fnr family transcriptional regulator [Pseudomonadota bacterium]
MNRLPIATARIPETLRRLAYFQGWPDAGLEGLAAGAKIILLPKHGSVARKNERLESLYVVVSGLIRIYIPLPNNMERVLSLVQPGESLDEACLILDEACPYDAVAAKDSHLLAIDATVFQRELSRDIALTQQALKLVSRRFLDLLRDTEICAQRSSVLRVASYLLLHRPTPEDLSFTFRLPARKQDVAAKLGLTQETFSRVLGFLDKQGLIQVSAGLIRVADAPKLALITTMKDCKDPSQEAVNLS